MRRRFNIPRLIGAAVAALFFALAAWLTGVDLTHHIKMRERVSEAWTGGGCER